MGKNLKGKELGEGISQRSDGYYVARFRSGNGTREQKVFVELNEAKQWIIDRKFHSTHIPANLMVDRNGDYSRYTVNEWFEYWNETYNRNLSPNTVNNYIDRFKYNVSPVVGKMKVTAVRPIHCQKILNNMKDEGYAAGTVYQTYICMGVVFRAAINNNIIVQHPLVGVSVPKGLKRKSVRALTVTEQKTFLKAIDKSHNKRQYRFILQTGLRTGEMIGLTWDCVDFARNELKINKQLQRQNGKDLLVPLKNSKPRYLTVPASVMQLLKDERVHQLEQRLAAGEVWQGWESQEEMKKALVFVKDDGSSITAAALYQRYKHLAEKIGAPESRVHDLRHTYAVLSLQNGDNVKTVQGNLGHATAAFTLDVYGHVSEKMKEDSAARMQAYIDKLA